MAARMTDRKPNQAGIACSRARLHARAREGARQGSVIGGAGGWIGSMNASIPRALSSPAIRSNRDERELLRMPTGPELHGQSAHPFALFPCAIFARRSIRNHALNEPANRSHIITNVIQPR